MDPLVTLLSYWSYKLQESSLIASCVNSCLSRLQLAPVLKDERGVVEVISEASASCCGVPADSAPGEQGQVKSEDQGEALAGQVRSLEVEVRHLQQALQVPTLPP